MIADVHEQDTRRFRGVSTVRPIDAAKDAVPIIDLADLLCGPGGLRRIGKEWTGRCPLPRHEDRSPSFTVNPEKNVFFCHGCLRGGDVVTLAALAWGYGEQEIAMAAANLLHEFGHEIPTQPPAWHRKQERQKPTRDGIEQVRKNIKRRRIFRYYILPDLGRIEDPEEYRQELDRAWSEFQEVPV